MEALEQDSVNQQKQQRINRSLVIRLLRRQGICSRADLAKLSGLKRATITNIIGEFIDCGLVVEDGLMDGDKGRRAIGVRINGARFQVLGAVVTRTHYSLSAMGLSGEMHEVRTYPLPEREKAGDVIDGMCRHLNEMIAASEAETLAIGIAIPGPYKEEDGEIIFVTNLVGWDGIALYTALQREFSIPVFVENDANAGVCAQLWYGERAADLGDMAYIVAGQGIGCGILSNGNLLKGRLGIAGEIGHTTICYNGPRCECGNYGCLEKYCSTLVLQENLRQRILAGDKTLLREGFTLDDVSLAIQSGDSVARAEYEAVCGFLAVGIVNIINQLNPGTVIIGDALADICPERMLQVIRARVRELVRPMVWDGLAIEVSRLPHNPILIGAGVVAATKVFENPFSYIAAGGKEDKNGGTISGQ